MASLRQAIVRLRHRQAVALAARVCVAIRAAAKTYPARQNSENDLDQGYCICLKYSNVPLTTALESFEPISSPTPVGPEFSHAVRGTLPTWKYMIPVLENEQVMFVPSSCTLNQSGKMRVGVVSTMPLGDSFQDQPLFQ